MFCLTVLHLCLLSSKILPCFHLFIEWAWSNEGTAELQRWEEKHVLAPQLPPFISRSPSWQSVWSIPRARLAGKTEGDGRLEGHGEKAEERPGQHAEGDDGKGDDLCRSQSTAFVFSTVSNQSSPWTVTRNYGNVLMCHRNRWFIWRLNRTKFRPRRRRSADWGAKWKLLKGILWLLNGRLSEVSFFFYYLSENNFYLQYEISLFDVFLGKNEEFQYWHACCCGSSLDVLLQGQRGEVESMITDMGVSQAAVEQLSIYCISLKK